MKQPSFKALLVVAAALAACCGCGSGAARSFPTGTVHGKLTLNEEPAPPGTQVFFMADSGDSASGVVGADGSFTIREVRVGKCAVSIGAAADSGELDHAAMMKMATGNGPSGEGANPAAFSAATSIPARYTDFSTSGVTFTVQEGVNEFSLDMKP